MLYFKTKKGRLIINIILDNQGPFQNVYMLISPGGDKSIYEYHLDFTNEKIWKQLEKIATPNVLEDNSVDLHAYETAIEEKQQFDQEMADIDWQMSMAVHYM